MKPFFRLTALCLVTALGTGCVSNTTFDAKKVNGQAFSSPSLYASLAKTDDGWRFEGIDQKGQGSLTVELGSYRLSLMNKPDKVCRRGLFGLTSGNCEEELHSFQPRTAAQF